MPSKPTPPTVTIHADGAASPNPGRGGYCAILQWQSCEKVLTGGFAHTTNNRMELMAVIVGLEALKVPCEVTVFTDSRYVSGPLSSGGIFRWRNNEWMLNRDKTKPVKNRDLWQRLLKVYEQHEVHVEWVAGHAGNAGNERCDTLATKARKQAGLPEDEGYDRCPSRSSPK